MATSPAVSDAERQWLRVLGTLNEFQARLAAAQRAIELGRGGITHIAQLTGMARPTITRGIAELHGQRPLEAAETGRIRRAGAGRPKVEARDPQALRELRRLLDATTAGDPMSVVKWTTRSTRDLADALRRRGHAVTWRTVARLLHDLEYSLQANVKTLEGPQHPDRDAQFRYLNARIRAFQRTGDPVISVDTKKKELVGQFRNAGQAWRRRGEPTAVFTHDFPHLGVGKAVPYGAYDLTQDRAVVNVGISHDTAEFAVESIRRWWRLLGRESYPRAKRLLISADAGGSNGPRLRAWKVELQALASEIGLPITVCHYPPGTSKWNKIEHRLFSFISLTWKGQPLVSYQTVVNLIGATRTRTGLRVKALLDRRTYQTGATITAEQFATIRLKSHSFHPAWNYTLLPNA
jgi:Rhodopirellula transposase DDE domain